MVGGDPALARLYGVLERIESKIDDLSTKQNSISAEVSDLSNTTKDLSHQLAAHATDNKDLSEKVDKISSRLESTCIAVRASQDATSSDCKSTASKVDMISSRVESMSCKVEGTSWKIDDVADKLDATFSKVDTSDNKLDQVSAKFNRVSDDLDVVSSDVYDLLRKEDTASLPSNLALSAINALSQRMETVLANTASTSEKLEGVVAQVASISSGVSAAAIKTDTAVSATSAIQQKMNNLEARVDLTSIRPKFDDIFRKLEQLSTQGDKTSKEVDAIGWKIDVTHSKTNEINNAVHKSAVKVDDLAFQGASTARKLDEIAAKLEDMQEECEEDSEPDEESESEEQDISKCSADWSDEDVGFFYPDCYDIPLFARDAGTDEALVFRNVHYFISRIECVAADCSDGFPASRVIRLLYGDAADWYQGTMSRRQKKRLRDGSLQALYAYLRARFGGPRVGQYTNIY